MIVSPFSFLFLLLSSSFFCSTGKVFFLFLCGGSQGLGYIDGPIFEDTPTMSPTISFYGFSLASRQTPTHLSPFFATFSGSPTMKRMGGIGEAVSSSRRL